jgi:hypothetical protein
MTWISLLSGTGRAIDDGLRGRWSATLSPSNNGADLTGVGNALVSDVALTTVNVVADTESGGTHAFRLDATSTWEKLRAQINSSLFGGQNRLSPLADAAHEMTLTYWAKSGTPGSVVRRHGYGSGMLSNNAAETFFVNVDNATPRKFGLRVSNGVISSAFITTGSDLPVTSSGWRLFSVRIKSGSQKIQVDSTVYLNTTDPITGWITYTVKGDSWFEVMGLQSGFDRPNSFLDSIRLYDRFLTDQEISDLIAAGRSESFAGSNTPPANTTPPAVTGAATQGQLLTSTTGVWTGTPAPTITLKWQRSANGSTGWADIAGATGATYLLTVTDVGQYIRSVATGTNSEGSTSANSNVVGPINGLATFKPWYASQRSTIIAPGVR